MNESSRPVDVSHAPPEASPRAARLARRLVSPVEAFLRVEAASGVVLLVAAVVALILANSPLSAAYHAALELPIGGNVGPYAFEAPLHFWINDGLMTVFFFVVGLEIRREIASGELSTPRRAALPAMAALGGMIAPALVYLAIAGGTPANRSGWAVPMATDIAFAVGVLALLGGRVPPALRVLLLALAIIDDVGSIVVIAVFYAGELAPSGFVLAAAGIAGILLMQAVGVRRAVLYVAPGLLLWLGVLKAGVHPTIAGVIAGLLTPARAWFGPKGLAHVARASAERFEGHLANGGEEGLSAEKIAREGKDLERARRESIAPVKRLEMLLHPWVAFVIMPVFALANAGVTLGSATSPSSLGAGVVAGLVLGKPIGILAASAISVRLGVATLPRGIGRRELLVLGIVAGVGFTMALFVAALAFEDPAKLDEAKAAVLAASAVAIVLSLVVGRALLRAPPEDAAKTASEAESSDEV